MIKNILYFYVYLSLFLDEIIVNNCINLFIDYFLNMFKFKIYNYYVK